jgi:transcriptional regulator with XRE-family HTH domain
MYTPEKAKESLRNLGAQIRLARQRRRWTLAELAKKMEVTSPTLIALEKGAVTVGVGVLVSALWILGLEAELQQIANPKDVEGSRLMDSRMPKKIRASQRKLENDF